MKPADNNLVNTKLDRELRAAQQQQLHSLRLQAGVYTDLWGPGKGTTEPRSAGDTAREARKKAQQCWAFSCSCYAKLQATRREAAAPVSTPAGEQLFGAEEVKAAAERRKIATLRRPFDMAAPAISRGSYSFCPSFRPFL